MPYKRKRVRANGKVEWVHCGRIRLPDGSHRHKTGFPSKKAAADWEARNQLAIGEGTWIDPEAGKMTLAEQIERWSKGRKIDVGSRKRDQSLIDARINPRFGGYSLAGIKEEEVAAWLVELVEVIGLAPGTVKKILDIMRRSLQAAVKAKRIPDNPLDELRVPGSSQVSEDHRYLTMLEVNELAEAMPDRFKALVWTGVLAGMRPGEIYGLRRSAILPSEDLLPWRIQVRETVIESGGRVATGKPKADSGRVISISAYLAEVLVDHCERYGVEEDGLVFTTEQGKPISRSWFHKRVFAPAVARSIGGRCRPYDLRHSHCALLIRADEHPKVISARMGHRSITTTMNTYGGLFTDYDVRAADALQAMVLETLAADDEEKPDAEDGKDAA